MAEVDRGRRPTSTPRSAPASTRVDAGYARFSGDALPTVPTDWSSVAPTPANLATPFGQLFGLLEHEADPDATDSLVSTMNKSADLLGIPQLSVTK